MPSNIDKQDNSKLGANIKYIFAFLDKIQLNYFTYINTETLNLYLSRQLFELIRGLLYTKLTLKFTIVYQSTCSIIYKIFQISSKKKNN